jgi:curli biogenesis system outer membrane secretion channel CsgG
MSTVIARSLPLALLAGALTFSSFGFTTFAAQAAPLSSVYSVTLATPLPQPKRDIIGGKVWRCEANRCSAAADGERASGICAKVAKKFGALAQFSGPHGVFSPDELVRCNGKS